MEKTKRPERNVSERSQRTLRMVQTALLCALAVALSTFQIPIFFGLSLNFALVPIVIAACIISPLAGCIVGACSGITTAIQTFLLASSIELYRVFIDAAPIFTAALCIVKTAAAGLIAGYLYRLINKVSAKRSLNALIPSAAVPIVNTGIFCLGVLLVFAKPLAESETFGAMASGTAIFHFVFIVLVGANFIVELLLNMILCPLIVKALYSTRLFKK